MTPLERSEPRSSLLRTLSALLTDAAAQAEIAVKAAEEGRHSQAIGTILPLEQTLPAANALLQAALTLHRLSWKGGAQ
jgi:hypothetical protein